MLNTIDLFSGAGGLTEGFRRNPFNLLAHVEMDTSTSKTLKIRDTYYCLIHTKNLTKYYDEILAEIPEKIGKRELI